jgi:hypothetical protein
MQTQVPANTTTLSLQSKVMRQNTLWGKNRQHTTTTLAINYSFQVPEIMNRINQATARIIRQNLETHQRLRNQWAKKIRHRVPVIINKIMMLGGNRPQKLTFHLKKVMIKKFKNQTNQAQVLTYSKVR